MIVNLKGKDVDAGNLFEKYGIDTMKMLPELTPVFGTMGSVSAANKLVKDHFAEYSNSLSWTPTRKISPRFEINDTSFAVLTFFKGKMLPYRICRFDELLDYELLEDGGSIAKGSFTGALVGGALFGLGGAIAGSVVGKKTKQIVTMMQIKLTLKDISKEPIYIELINGKTKTDSSAYKTAYGHAQDILSTLAQIVNAE